MRFPKKYIQGLVNESKCLSDLFQLRNFVKREWLPVSALSIQYSTVLAVCL